MRAICKPGSPTPQKFTSQGTQIYVYLHPGIGKERKANKKNLAVAGTNQLGETRVKIAPTQANIYIVV